MTPADIIVIIAGGAFGGLIGFIAYLEMKHHFRKAKEGK